MMMRAFIFLESNNLLPNCKVQKGCRRRSYGYKDQLLINKALLEEVRFATRRPLSVLINTFTLLHFVKDPDDRKSFYSISRQSMKFNRELGVPAIPPAEDEANTTYALRTKAKAKHQGRQLLRLKLESKSLHGKYPQRMNRLEQDRTHRWLKAAGLKAETEDFIIAAQDQSLPTR